MVWSGQLFWIIVNLSDILRYIAKYIKSTDDTNCQPIIQIKSDTILQATEDMPYPKDSTKARLKCCIGPSGVRLLPLGCRQKRSGHSTWRYFSFIFLSFSPRSLLLYQKEGRQGSAILHGLLSNKNIRIPIKKLLSQVSETWHQALQKRGPPPALCNI